jgi:hypothetical protein
MGDVCVPECVKGGNPLPCDEIRVGIGNWSYHREREMGRGKISISSFLVVISRRDDDKRSSARAVDLIPKQIPRGR